MTDKEKFRAEIERLRGSFKVLSAASPSRDTTLEYIAKAALCDEILSFIDSLQEEPVSTRDKLRALSDGKQHLGWLDDAKEVEEESASERRDIFDNYLKSKEKFILPQKISGNINCENCLHSSACALGDIQACIIDKPVSDDLEKEIEQYCIHHGYLYSFKDCDYTFNEEVGDIARYFANWQKQQDQSTIELAEDHAMFAGMEKMKEQIIAKAIDAELYSDGMLTPIIKVNDKEKISDIKFGDEVKVIVIKKD